MGIKSHLKNKEQALNKIKVFKDKIINPVLKIEDIEIDQNFLEKIDNTYKQLDNEKFVIAMFGSYSDGKSSIIKAITNESDIAISPVPTTDKVEEYNYENSLVIVDTPGLFSENDIHSKITKDYISESNLIIYVIDPENPIKDSQKGTVEWLLKDLNKLDSTLFVINKMDVVTDIEDEDDYDYDAKIKIEVVEDTLKQLGVKPKKENIIAISADPYGYGLDFWGNKIEEYNEISRINLLIEKLNSYLEKYKEELLFGNVDSVIQDCTNQFNKVFEEKREINNNLIEISTSQLQDAEKKLNQLTKDVTDSYRNIKERMKDLREDYINKLSRINNHNEYNTFFNEYIGEENYILNDKIDSIMKFETENSLETQKRLSDELKNQAHKYDEASESAVKKILGQTSGKITKSINIIPRDQLANGIKVFRDTTRIPIKFKPWGIQKLAKKLKFGGAALGAGIEIFSTYSEIKKKNELDSKLAKNKEFIFHFFKELNEKIDYDSYINDYFPTILQTQKSIEIIKEKIKELEEVNLQVSN
ncbi:LeoA/HP0731 family dynamin-like GTPase, partial [Staphylococcus haemolyticus]|uniref:LeoA/HP0731 family dynamin-like GTPase n=1 Tax=Staphylococcus haemolyticus TaxID=1283 RepID=UPI000D4EDFBE